MQTCEIFAMSNPTMNGLCFLFFTKLCLAECTAADAFKHAGENIVFAKWKPIRHVELGNVTLTEIHYNWFSVSTKPNKLKYSNSFF